jgi:predicted alpha-1,2-mannosidase
MKCKYFFLACILNLLTVFSKAQSFTSFVDPLIGSGGHGHVFVGASVPFGAVQAGPDNFYKGWDWCSGYHYSDSVIIGFAQTHLSGTGIGDLGDVLIMPYTGEIKTSKGSEKNLSSGYASKFSHANEKVKPGYYSVKLDNKVNVELTASERVAYHRYHFPSNSAAHIIIDLKEGISDGATDTYIEQTDATTFKGYRFSRGWAKDQRLFFAIKISKPVNDFKVYDDTVLMQDKKGKGKAIKGLISFDNFSGDVDLKVGISPVSYDNALANINAEIPAWNFEEIVQRADKKWNDELSKIKIETNNDTDKKIFYTALYHTLIDPALYNDANGDYLGTDKQLHHASFNNYSEFSMWDTYRALNPLYTIFQPEKVNDIIQSFLAIYQQQNKLPVWHLQGNETNTMPGISSVQVVCEAYIKGFRGFDTTLALEAVKNSMMLDWEGLQFDKNFQYIPSDSLHESVARALEYSISNASIALMEKQAGNKNDYDYFNKRYHNYLLYFDSSVGFMRGKKANGTWNPEFIPSKASRPYINDYSEGNAWQYLWLVPEDVEGLIHLLGGDKNFNTKLDSLFTIHSEPDPKAPPDIAGLIGQYAHGDEPSHATIYLYAYSGEQWKTAEKARFILKNLYKDNTDEGMSGNDDCGQMSAWYILSSLGFYPVFPANGAYVFGSPLFDKASIKLPHNKTFTVETVNNNAQNIYIQKAELNGKPYNKTYIMYDDIMKGGTLKFTMGAQPNPAYGTDLNDRPKSVYSK